MPLLLLFSPTSNHNMSLGHAQTLTGNSVNFSIAGIIGVYTTHLRNSLTGPMEDWLFQFDVLLLPWQTNVLPVALEYFLIELEDKMQDDKPLILNLGCGDRVSSKCVNIDWAIHLRLSGNKPLLFLARPFLTPARKQYIGKLADGIMVHDLSKGIPFDDETVDAVYHSHMLEHIDRESVDTFQKEVFRVLKKGGIQRICVPDLRTMALNYLESFDKSRTSKEASLDHDSFVHDILEQCVRKEASGTSQQPPLRRRLENLFLGDARSRGETHQWMYDSVNLGAILHKCGYEKITQFSYDKSDIPGWKSMGLETSELGQEYKPGSLYLESVK